MEISNQWVMMAMVWTPYLINHGGFPVLKWAKLNAWNWPVILCHWSLQADFQEWEHRQGSWELIHLQAWPSYYLHLLDWRQSCLDGISCQVVYWPPWKTNWRTEHADSEEDARNATVEQVKMLGKISIQSASNPPCQGNVIHTKLPLGCWWWLSLLEVEGVGWVEPLDFGVLSIMLAAQWVERMYWNILCACHLLSTVRCTYRGQCSKSTDVVMVQQTTHDSCLGPEWERSCECTCNHYFGSDVFDCDVAIWTSSHVLWYWMATMRTNNGKTPCELFYNMKPHISHIHPLGCTTKVVLPT